MYKYRIIGFAFSALVLIIDYYTYEKFIIAFKSYNYYSIGFRLLIHLYPLEMILLNEKPFLFHSSDEIYEKKWRMMVEGKSYYKSKFIKHLDFTIIIMIIISFLIMVVGGLRDYVLTHLIN
jgi:hypothetical protein